MPRGGFRDSRGKKSKKGQRRHFTDEEALKDDKQKQEREKNWRRRQGDDSGSEEEVEGGAKKATKEQTDGNASGSDSSNDEGSGDEDRKSKGVEGMIEVENPNRAIKQSKKVSEINTEHKTVLSRREREELEKTEAKKRYDALHIEGKTTEAQADLARLALIRKMRDEQAKKRDEEKRVLEEKAKQKAACKGKS